MTRLDPIQMLWVRGRLSRMELLGVRSFLANGHPVHLYTYDCPENVPSGVDVLDAAAIVPRSKVPPVDRGPFTKGTLGSFSDFFRYTLLDNRGGWWSDVDIVCTRPWRFAQPALTASTHEHGFGRIANTCVLRFPAGDPIIRACRDSCSRLDLPNVGIDSTGPNLLHHHLMQSHALSLCAAPDVFCRCRGTPAGNWCGRSGGVSAWMS